MPRFIQERAPRKDREPVDFESEAIRTWSAARAEAERLERQGSGKFAASALDRARTRCIALFEGAMEAGQPGIAEIVAWHADLDPELRARARTAYRAKHPRCI